MAGIRALLGLFPKTSEYESSRNQLESEFNDLMAFKNSRELQEYRELESQVQSEEFLTKKKEILELRYKNTDDYQKEKEFKTLSKSSAIKLYYKTLGSADLSRFEKLDESDSIKRYQELEAYVASDEFASIKKESSQSAKVKFSKSDLAKTLDQYNQQKKSPNIAGYYKFLKNKNYTLFKQAIDEGLEKQAEKLKKDGNTDELKQLQKSKTYKAYQKLKAHPYHQYYQELHGSPEIEAFEDLQNFITSDEFKRQKKEIESKGFKDTEAYEKLQEFNNLKKSDDIRFYFKFKKSKALKNYNDLKGSEQIKSFETLKAFVESDEFLKFRNYCLMSPKKRWMESPEYQILQDYELKKKSEKIQWFFKNYEHKRFNWHRTWKETFHEDFDGPKVDAKKWLTRYYWGDKMFKGSYSLSSDKHYVTDGKNLTIDNGRLHISIKKEQAKGNSWDPKYGFVKRDFAYTSGVLNTGNSFKQKYGTFEAKIKHVEHPDLISVFALIGKTMLPHIDISKAGKKLRVGNYWGDSHKAADTLQKFSKTRKKSKFTTDFYIYTLEWKPGVLVWKINGLEIAKNTTGVPEEEMYLNLSAGLKKAVEGTLPAHMEVDWVRCYQQAEKN